MLNFAFSMKIIITLGSNTHQEENVSAAQILLKQCYKDISFSETRWTEPIGIESDKFLNCTGTFETDLPPEKVKQQLKEIERKMGDSHENHQQGKVLIDIDLVQYDGKIVKGIIWLETSEKK